MRIRTDHRSFSDTRLVNHTSRPDQNAVADLGIADHAIGTNPAFAPNSSGAENLNEGFDGCVRTDLDIAVNNAGLRVENRDASSHELLGFCRANAPININQL